MSQHSWQFPWSWSTKNIFKQTGRFKTMGNHSTDYKTWGRFRTWGINLSKHRLQKHRVRPSPLLSVESFDHFTKFSLFFSSAPRLSMFQLSLYKCGCSPGLWCQFSPYSKICTAQTTAVVCLVRISDEFIIDWFYTSVTTGYGIFESNSCGIWKLQVWAYM